MNPYDTEAVHRVWARVTAIQEERLSAMIADERRDCETYLLLSRTFPRYRSFFRSLANDELQHAKKLSAVYTSLYGRNADVALAPPKQFSNLRDAVQERYAEELSGAQTYQQAAAQFAAHRDLFLMLSAQEKKHAQRLRNLKLPHP